MQSDQNNKLYKNKIGVNNRPIKQDNNLHDTQTPKERREKKKEVLPVWDNTLSNYLRM